jgi:HEAT repeat protein
LNGETTGSGLPSGLSEEYIEHAVFFVVNWHAATVNVRLYPPSSSMVTDTIENARAYLEDLLSEGKSFSVSVLENSLLVNDVRLSDVDQQKAPVKSFVNWMNERGLSTIEFHPGISQEELTDVFEVLAAAPEMDQRADLSVELLGRGITHASINQRVYVAVSAGEDLSEGIRKASPLDTMKDEILMRYLMGRVNLGEVQDRELVDILSNPGKVGGLLSTFIAEEGTEGGVLIRSQKAEEALSSLSEMISHVEDEDLRELLSTQMSSVIAEMRPREMSAVLTGDGPQGLDIARIRERVLTILSDDKLYEVVDSLIDEYNDMKETSDTLDLAWQKEKLASLNALLLGVHEERGEAVSEVVDDKLEQAGVIEEREPSTGRRVLSAFQLLGGPLEEEYVELADGIDQTVSEQIRRLYEMEERELASGMLEKLAVNLDQESAAVRRFAATLVKETLETLKPEYRLMAADVLEDRLAGDLDVELDYAAFVPQVDSMAIIARAYMQEGMPDRANGILDLLETHTALEGKKGPELVKHAASLLERLTGPEGMVDIPALLMEKDELKRLRTVRALAEMGPQALAPLVDIVKDRGQIELREKALEAIVAAGEAGTQALLAEMHRENEWYVHRNILNVIADLKLTVAAGDISEMMSNPDERLRREAVRCLARVGATESVQVVKGAVTDSSPAVRKTAVRVLGMFKDPTVAEYLVEIINGQGPRGKDEDQSVVEAACLALGDLHDVSYAPRLVELLGKGGLFKKSRPDEIRAAACIALGAIGDESLVPVLQKAAGDPSMMVRSSAEKALRKLSGGITSPQPVPPEELPEAVVEAPPEEPEEELEEYRPPPHPEAQMGSPFEEPVLEKPTVRPAAPGIAATGGLDEGTPVEGELPPWEAPSGLEELPSPVEWVDEPTQPEAAAPYESPEETGPALEPVTPEEEYVYPEAVELNEIEPVAPELAPLSEINTAAADIEPGIQEVAGTTAPEVEELWLGEEEAAGRATQAPGLVVPGHPVPEAPGPGLEAPREGYVYPEAVEVNEAGPVTGPGPLSPGSVLDGGLMESPAEPAHPAREQYEPALPPQEDYVQPQAPGEEIYIVDLEEQGEPDRVQPPGDLEWEAPSGSEAPYPPGEEPDWPTLDYTPAVDEPPSGGLTDQGRISRGPYEPAPWEADKLESPAPAQPAPEAPPKDKSYFAGTVPPAEAPGTEAAQPPWELDQPEISQAPPPAAPQEREAEEHWKVERESSGSAPWEQPPWEVEQPGAAPQEPPTRAPADTGGAPGAQGFPEPPPPPGAGGRQDPAGQPVLPATPPWELEQTTLTPPAPEDGFSSEAPGAQGDAPQPPQERKPPPTPQAPPGPSGWK